jgi:hypothetical protein
MSKGLSTQQRRILGFACAVNRLTNHGELKQKTGPDYRTQYQFEWRLMIPFGGSIKCERLNKLRDGRLDRQHYEMRRGPLSLASHSKSIDISIKRSIKSLISHGCIVQTDGFDFFIGNQLHHYYWGCVLTQKGIDIGQEHEATPVDLLTSVECLRSGHVLKTFHVREVLASDKVDDENKRRIESQLRRRYADE